MILDGALQFTGTAGLASAMTDSPTTGTQQSTNVIDLLNARDLGIGDDPSLELLIQIMTTFTGGTSLQVQLQGAPDNGSGLPGSYTTMWDSGAIAEASLVTPRYIMAGSVPRTLLPTGVGPSSAQALPRFLRLQYVTVGTHGAGALNGFIILDRQDSISYPPGIVIAN
jgi:Bbp16